MEQRTLGKSALAVSAIGLGCMSMSNVYGKGDDAESIAVVHRALDLGVNFLDSSDLYGWGQGEELLSRALKGKRDRVVLATKFGNMRGPDGSFLGLSEASPATVRRAHAVHPIAALQSEFSLLYREEAEETLPTLRELGIAFVAYSPLGRSLLTDSTHAAAEIPPDDRRRDHPRFQDENLRKNLTLVRPLVDMARQKGCTPGQLALAWLLARGRDIVPIPGTKRIARLEENVAAARVSLTPAEVTQLSEAVPVGAAAGTRYPGGAMKSVYI